MSNPLFKYNKDALQQLNELTLSILKKKSRVTICVIGKTGSGKSGFGRYLRKKGIGNIAPRKVSVIDDGVMSIRFLGIFNKRIKNNISTSTPDELSPFLPYIKACPILVYVSSNPVKRLSKTDIIVKITIDDEERLSRLIKRNGDANGKKRYDASNNVCDIKLPHSEHFMQIKTDDY